MPTKIIAVLAALCVGFGFGAGYVVTGVAHASSSCWYSARGCVSVGGYYKPSTRSYVNPYYRNYPSHRPSYGYRAPSYRVPSYRVPSYGSSYGAW